MPEYTHQDYVIMAIIATARPDVRLAAMALCEFLQQLDQAGGSLHQTAHPAAWNDLLRHIPANQVASLLRRCGMKVTGGEEIDGERMPMSASRSKS